MSASIKALQLAPTPFQGIDNHQTVVRIYFVVIPTGNYAALGDTIDFTSLGDLVMSEYAPIFVVIQSAKSGGASGFDYSYNPGTTMSNGKFQVFTGAAAQSPLTELTAGAYPAGVTGDTIIGYADFIRI